MSDEKPMGQVIQIDEARIRDHLGEMVRGTVVPIANIIRLARTTNRVILSPDVGRLEIAVVTSDWVLPIARVT